MSWHSRTSTTLACLHSLSFSLSFCLHYRCNIKCNGLLLLLYLGFVRRPNVVVVINNNNEKEWLQIISSSALGEQVLVFSVYNVLLCCPSYLTNENLIAKMLPIPFNIHATFLTFSLYNYSLNVEQDKKKVELEGKI